MLLLLSLNSFNWYQFDSLYTHMFIVYVYFQLVSSIGDWYSFYFIHIYLFYLCSRYKFAQMLFMLELELQLYFNWFSFQLVSYVKPIVTPRSHGYGDVTATYIRKSEVPSRIYAKHQYRQESEYGSNWCIIHSNTYIQLQGYHQSDYNITWISYH